MNISKIKKKIHYILKIVRALIKLLVNKNNKIIIKNITIIPVTVMILNKTSFNWFVMNMILKIVKDSVIFNLKIIINKKNKFLIMFLFS